MKVITKTIYYFEKEDKEKLWDFIKQQGITMSVFIKNCNISRTYFYDMIKGKENATERVIESMKKNGFDPLQ